MFACVIAIEAKHWDANANSININAPAVMVHEKQTTYYMF